MTEPETPREPLKPCPFCGDTPKQLSFGSGSTYRWLTAGCPECGWNCEIRKTTPYDVTEPTPEEIAAAVTEWNTRPIEDALRARAETAEARVRELETLLARWHTAKIATLAADDAFRKFKEYGIWTPDDVRRGSALKLASLEANEAFTEIESVARRAEAAPTKEQG